MHLVLFVAQALDGLEREILVLRRRRHGDVEAADGRLGRLVGLHAGVDRPAEVVEGLLGAGVAALRLLLQARVHERVVDLHECVAAVEGQAGHVLVELRRRRIGALRGGHGLHRFQCALGGVAFVDGGFAAGLVDDGAAGGFEHGVEPHDHALVLRGLHADVGGLALVGERSAVRGDFLPRARRRRLTVGPLRHQRLAVPHELRVRVQRSAVDLVVPRGGFHRAGQRAVLDPLGDVLRELDRPARFGELGGPRDVQTHDVEGIVAADDAPRQLQALVVGLLGGDVVLDGVPAVGLVRAFLRGGGVLVDAVGGAHEPQDGRPALVGAAGRQHRGCDGQRGEQCGGFLLPRSSRAEPTAPPFPIPGRGSSLRSRHGSISSSCSGFDKPFLSVR